MAVKWGMKKDGTYGILDAAELSGLNQTVNEVPTQIGPTQTAATGLGESLYLGRTPEQWQQFGASGGMVGDSSIEGQALANQTVLAGKENDFMGMNPDQWGSALKMGQIGIGAGQLGLGLASYFQNKGLADKQKELLGQQIESNRSEIDARKNYRSALEGFGSQSQPTRI